MASDSGVPTLEIEGRVATITLRRPEKANVLQPEDLAEIYTHIGIVNDSEQVLVLLLKAEGKYFCSGFDIGRIGGQREVEFDQLVNALEDARPVTIAVIQGGVYGGATDLALACDFRLGSIDIDMFMPAARLGLHFYPRGLQRYASRMGLDTAKRLFLTAERINAQEMHRVGYLTELLDGEELTARAVELSQTIAGMAPLAVIGMKKNLNRLAQGTLDQGELMADIATAYKSEDLQEGRRPGPRSASPSL